jgi:hypothetical protein
MSGVSSLLPSGAAAAAADFGVAGPGDVPVMRTLKGEQ